MKPLPWFTLPGRSWMLVVTLMMLTLAGCLDASEEDDADPEVGPDPQEPSDGPTVTAETTTAEGTSASVGNGGEGVSCCEEPIETPAVFLSANLSLEWTGAGPLGVEYQFLNGTEVVSQHYADTSPVEQSFKGDDSDLLGADAFAVVAHEPGGHVVQWSVEIEFEVPE